MRKRAHEPLLLPGSFSEPDGEVAAGEGVTAAIRPLEGCA